MKKKLLASKSPFPKFRSDTEAAEYFETHSVANVWDLAAGDVAVNPGRTPVAARRLVAGEYLVRLRAEGANPLDILTRVEPGKNLQLRRTLLAAGKDWDGMVRVEESQAVPAFLIDRYEVTNRQFAKLLRPAVTEMRACGRQQVRGVSSTVRADHPVTRVSWDEATAYSRWRGASCRP